MIDKFVQALKSPKRLEGRPKGFMTARELADELGIDHNLVSRKLRVMFERGEIEVAMIEMMRIHGAKTKIPAYRLKGKK